LMTRETVACDTLARRAISFIVILFFTSASRILYCSVPNG
jgi:hypothetical protein